MSVILVFISYVVFIHILLSSYYKKYNNQAPWDRRKVPGVGTLRCTDKFNDQNNQANTL